MKTFPLIYICILICLTTSQLLVGQELSLQGQVSVHNSLYETGSIEYVQDAYVSADFAIATKTDIAGNFNLIFQRITKGDKIELTVEKEEYEVVNKRDLHDLIIGRLTPLKIYLSPKGQLARAQTELYDISLAAITTKHDALIAELRKGGEENKGVIEQLEQKLNKEIAHRFEAEDILREKLEATKKRLPEVVKQLVIVNLDFASETYRLAYESYKAGDIEQAIAILDEAQLSEQVKEALVQIEQLKKDKTNFQITLEQVEEQVGQIIASYTLKAESYYLIFDYRAALKVYQKVVSLLEETKGKNDLAVADAYNLLSGLHRDVGEYKKAFDYTNGNISIKEQLLAEDDIELAIAYNNLSLVYQNLGEYKKAVEVSEKAIAIFERNLGHNKQDLAIFYNNLSVSYQNIGAYDKALAAQRKAIDLQELILGEHHPDLANSYNNLALIHRELGAYEDALKNQQKDIVIRKHSLSANHPSLATSYNNLALIFQDLGDYKAALKMQQKALAIQQQVLDPVHPSVGEGYSNLAQIYIDLNNYDLALEAAQEAISIYEKTLASNHPNTAIAYNNLAMIYQGLKQYKKALHAQQKSIAMKEASAKDMGIVISYNNLALIYQDLKDYEKALQTLQKAINIAKQALKPDHPDFATLYDNLARIYQSLTQNEEAMKAQQKAIAIRKSILPKYHPDLAIAYHNLASIFSNVKQIDSAIYFEQTAFLILKDKLPDSHPDLETAKASLAFYHDKRGSALEKKGNYQKAIEDYKEALPYTKDKAIMNNKIGLCYYNLKDFNQAIEYYEKSHKLNPANKVVYLNNTGLAYVRNGKFEEAQKRFEQFQSLLPTFALVYKNWAIYYALQKDKTTALNNLEKAVDLGFRNLNKITDEEAFQILHSEPRYEAIIQKLQSKK